MGLGFSVSKRFGGQQLRRGAIAALDGAGLDERLLERMQPFGVLPALLRVLAQRLDRRHTMAVGLGRQHRARSDRHAVEQHGAGAAFARLAAVLDAEHAVPPQRVEERFVDGDVPGLGSII